MSNTFGPAIKPKYIKMYNMVIDSYHIGNYEQCKSVIGQIKKTGDRALIDLTRLGLAKEYYSEGNIEDAKKMFESLQGTDYDRQAREFLGKIAVKNGEDNIAINYFTKLIQKYNDQTALYNMGLLEVKKGNYENAKNYLVQVISPDMQKCTLEVLLSISVYQQNFKESFNYINKYLEMYGTSGRISSAIAYLEKAFNIFFPDRFHRNMIYSVEQIYKYSEDKALEHISNHCDENNMKNIHTRFNLDIDVSMLFNNIKLELNKLPFILTSVCKKFIIPYNNVGMNGESFLLVITTMNNEIISMYPVAHENDFMELDNEQSKLLVKHI